MTLSAPGLPPGLPVDDEGPVFREPWEAQAFAMAVKLHRDGHFTWPEWVSALGATIAAGDPHLGYYHHWLAALEKIVAEKRLAAAADLAARKAELEAAPPPGHDHEAKREPVCVA